MESDCARRSLAGALDGQNMNGPIGSYRDEQAWFIAVEPGCALQLPFAGKAFVCLLWSASTSVEPGDRAAIADALVAAGCLYAVCGGLECEAWHDAVDEACRVRSGHGVVPDEKLVMTTWHRNEPPEDVVDFFLTSTDFGSHEFSNYLVLVVGRDESMGSHLRELVRKRGFAQRAV